MKRNLTTVLCCPDCASDLVLVDETPTQSEVESGSLGCRTCGVLYPIIQGVPRFVESDAYVGSFSYEWNRWNTVQLDSANGGRGRRRYHRLSREFHPGLSLLGFLVAAEPSDGLAHDAARSSSGDEWPGSVEHGIDARYGPVLPGASKTAMAP